MDLLQDLVKGKRLAHIADTDLDGVSCRLLAEYFLAPICKLYKPFNTADRTMSPVPDNFFENVDIVLFSDIAPPSLEYYNNLKNKGLEIIIVDHHDTSKNILGNLEFYFYSDQMCATKLFYELLTEGKRKYQLINDYVMLVDVYDMWRTQSPIRSHAEGLHHYLMGTIPWFSNIPDSQRSDTFLKKQMKKFQERPTQKFFFDLHEQTIIKKAKQKIENNYKTAKKNLQKRVDGNGNKYLFTECPSKISFIADRILKEYKEYDYIAIRATFVKSEYKFSLRSANGFEVNKIAEKYNGGGHKASAGMQLDEEQYNLFKLGKIHLI